MTYELDAAGISRLEAYFEGIGVRLGEKRRRASFALYAMGILGEHERKSVEPLAAAAADDPEGAQRAHDHLLHFIGQSEWEDGPVREFFSGALNVIQFWRFSRSTRLRLKGTTAAGS